MICMTWNVEVGVFVPVLLRQAKVDDADCITTFAGADQDVAWFEVAVDEMARMYVF
jgi:hypothetical protein